MTALATREEARAPGHVLTPDEIALIKRQIMSAKREPTDDELALFVHQCDRTGLDPFSDQIYAIFRWDRNVRDEVMKVQVSIHGLRLVADRTRAYAPGNEYWCGDDGVWRDVWMEDTPPKAARVTIRKLVGNQLIEFSVPALWKEFAPYKDGKLTGVWSGKPSLMLAKCSEALGLRKAFPNETSGLYTREEMAQAEAEREDVIVTEVRDAFQATEELPSAPAPVDTDPDISSGTKAPEPAPQQAAPMDNGAVNSTDPITPEEVQRMTEYLGTIGTPESFWRMGLMTLGLDTLDQLNKGQAHQLMRDATARFKSE